MKQISGLWPMETWPLLQKRKYLWGTVVQITALVFAITGMSSPTEAFS